MPVSVFREHKYSSFHVAFRIAIQGADVTSFVTDDAITVKLSDRDGPNTISFSLQNARNNFILTEENLGWDETAQKSIPSLGKWRGSSKKQFGDQPHYSEQPKRQIYEYKQSINLRSTSNIDTDSSHIDTYQFKPGTIVINKNDPIRLFIHNPLVEYVDETKGEWIPFFTGFIDSKPLTNDYIDGMSKLSITGSCIKKQLQKMRLSFTPIVQFTGEMINELLYDTPASSFYRDLIWQDNQGMYHHPFTDKNFHDSISVLMLGDENLPEGKQGNRCKVGFASRGRTFRGVNPYALSRSNYNPTTHKEITNDIQDASFAEWYDLLIFGDRHLTSQPPDALPYYTTNEMTEILARTVTFDTDYSPWSTKLHMLLPPADVEFTKLIDENIVQVRPKREWAQTRYDCLLQLCTLIDFQFITTPMGDLVFEYPMYDYIPYDWGSDWESTFIVDKSAISDTIDTESGDVTTGLIVTAGIETIVTKGLDNNLPDGYFNKVIIKSDILAGKYGVKFEPWEAPIGRQAKKGVKMDNLRIAGLIEFQRRLADIDRATLNFSFHPYLLPNRNIMWVKQKKIAWVGSVEYTINLFKDITVSTEVSLIRDYALTKKIERTIIGYDTTGNPIYSTLDDIDSLSGLDIVYTYVFGGAQMPLSYKDIASASSIETRLKGNYGIHVLYEPSKTEKQNTTEQQIDAYSKDHRGE